MGWLLYIGTKLYPFLSKYRYVFDNKYKSTSVFQALFFLSHFFYNLRTFIFRGWIFVPGELYDREGAVYSTQHQGIPLHHSVPGAGLAGSLPLCVPKQWAPALHTHQLPWGYSGNAWVKSNQYLPDLVLAYRPSWVFEVCLNKIYQCTERGKILDTNIIVEFWFSEKIIIIIVSI